MATRVVTFDPSAPVADLIKEGRQEESYKRMYQKSSHMIAEQNRKIREQAILIDRYQNAFKYFEMNNEKIATLVSQSNLEYRVINTYAPNYYDRL